MTADGRTNVGLSRRSCSTRPGPRAARIAVRHDNIPSRTRGPWCPLSHRLLYYLGKAFVRRHNY